MIANRNARREQPCGDLDQRQQQPDEAASVVPAPEGWIRGGRASCLITPEGWLSPAEQRPSAYCDERPADTIADLLVIHNISLPPGQFGGPWVDDLFLGRLDTDADPHFQVACAAGPVSAHLLIRRDGCVIQYVPFDKRAWHAGRSSFDGRARCNDYSIGIELEGDDEHPFDDAQYEALARCTRAIMITYPGIVPGRIVGHSDVAPGRKTDPGPFFDWARFHRAIV